MTERTSSTPIKPHDLITEEHVTEALKSDKGIGTKLISWKIEDFTKHGDNMATFVTSVHATFSQNDDVQSVSYAVKLNPCITAEDFKATTVTLFLKEARFYRELVPELNSVLEEAGQPPLRIPKCYHSSHERGREFLFLEDLRPRGFRMCEKGFHGIDVAHTMLIIKELARYHSASLVLIKRQTLQALADKFDFLKLNVYSDSDSQANFFNQLMTKGNNATIAILEHVGGYEKAVDWVKGHKTSFLDIMLDTLKSSPPYDVICHGDAHINNILFRYNDVGEPVEVMLLDHQVNRIASVATDLNFILYSSLAGVVRQPNLEAFLETYFSSFCEVVTASGEQVSFSLEDLRQEFRNKLPLGLALSSFASQMTIGDQSEIPDREEFFGNTDVVLSAEQKKKYFKNVENNHDLRQKFLDIFDEMEEAGLFD